MSEDEKLNQIKNKQELFDTFSKEISNAVKKVMFENSDVDDKILFVICTSALQKELTFFCLAMLGENKKLIMQTLSLLIEQSEIFLDEVEKGDE